MWRATSSRAARSVLVAVADVPRRRAGLEAVVAALAGGPMPVVSWAAAGGAARARRAASTTSSPWTRRRAASPTRSCNATPRAHLAWGPAEAEFAIAAYRAALDLRPQLTELYRALRELPADAGPNRLRGRPPRPRALPAPRGGLRPPPHRPHRARPDRARPRRTDLPHVDGDRDRPRALTDLPRSPRRARGNRAGAGARAAAGRASRSNRLAARVSGGDAGTPRLSPRSQYKPAAR